MKSLKDMASIDVVALLVCAVALIMSFTSLNATAEANAQKNREQDAILQSIPAIQQDVAVIKNDLKHLVDKLNNGKQ